MAAAVINAIILGIAVSVPLIRDAFPKQAPDQTVVRIVAGETENGQASYNTGGNRPSVSLFDSNGHRIGVTVGYDTGDISDGNFFDVSVKPITDGNNRPTEYLSLTGSGTDAICVAYITVTSPNSDFRTWNGDFAKFCGAPWYPSNYPYPSSDVRPSCVWLSEDDRFYQGYSMHLLDFSDPTTDSASGLSAQYMSNSDTLCNAPARQGFHKIMTPYNCVAAYATWPSKNEDGTDHDFSEVIGVGAPVCLPPPGVFPTIDEISEIPDAVLPSSQGGIGNKRQVGGRPSLTERRAVYSNSTTKPHPCESRLNVSPHIVHSAKEVCESTTSWGADFVSTHDGLYCDMCEKQLWPLCEDGHLVNCFDLTSGQLHANEEELHKRSTHGTPKSYAKVTHWS